MTFRRSLLSSLPKPVQFIEVEKKNLYFVPSVKIGGKIITKFQYLSLHEIKLLYCKSWFINFSAFYLVHLNLLLTVL